MVFIDFLFIIGFIVYVVLKALGESTKKRQEYERRAKQVPKSQVPETEVYEPDLTTDYFPTLSGEEETNDEFGWLEEFGQDTSTVPEGYDLEKSSLKNRIETDNILMDQKSFSHRSEGLSRDKQIILEVLSPNYSLQLTTEQIWQGIIWSEILNSPKCRKYSR